MLTIRFLVPVGDLSAEGDKVISYVENQGCCVWAIDTTGAGDDPPVFD